MLKFSDQVCVDKNRDLAGKLTEVAIDAMAGTTVG